MPRAGLGAVVAGHRQPLRVHEIAHVDESSRSDRREAHTSRCILPNRSPVVAATAMNAGSAGLRPIRAHAISRSSACRSISMQRPGSGVSRVMVREGLTADSGSSPSRLASSNTMPTLDR